MTYLSACATQVGVTNEFAFYLVAIANAASAVGRFSAGWLADRVGSCYLPLMDSSKLMYIALRPQVHLMS